MINRPRLKTIFSTIALEDYFDRKLNLPRCGGGLGQQSRRRVQGSSAIENICVDSLSRRRKIGMIENVENLGAELDIKPFRDALDVVVLEQRKVERRNPRTDHDVSPCIAAKIEALRERGSEWRS